MPNIADRIILDVLWRIEYDKERLNAGDAASTLEFLFRLYGPQLSSPVVESLLYKKRFFFRRLNTKSSSL